MSKDNCFPKDSEVISSSSDLKKMLQKIKEGIQSGVLKQCRPENTDFALDDAFEVADEKSWPDYIEAYFEDKSGAKYKLVVETFHGAGGTWGEI